jgi:hypothetical protein
LFSFNTDSAKHGIGATGIQATFAMPEKVINNQRILSQYRDYERTALERPSHGIGATGTALERPETRHWSDRNTALERPGKFQNTSFILILQHLPKNYPQA